MTTAPTTSHSTDPALLEIQQIVRRRFPDSTIQAMIFGSRARGTATKRSDRDIALHAKYPLDIMDVQSLRDDFYRTPYRVDVVDLARASSTFVTQAIRDSISI